MDFNDAPVQTSFDLIPNNTVAVVSMKIRAGHAGESGWLRKSNDGSSEGLDVEFTIMDGRHKGRKFWTLFTMTGTTMGHKKAGVISRGRLKAIIDSATGFKPDDQSDAAQRARRSENGYSLFQGIRFLAKVGVEKRKGYANKNILKLAITPDMDGWHSVAQDADRDETVPF